MIVKVCTGVLFVFIGIPQGAQALLMGFRIKIFLRKQPLTFYHWASLVYHWVL